MMALFTWHSHSFPLPLVGRGQGWGSCDEPDFYPPP